MGPSPLPPDPGAPDPSSGVSGSRYRSVRVLGQGSFGKAILVEEKATQRLCVVKQINFGKLLSPKERSECQQEANLLHSLRHPNIVTYIDSYIKGSARG